jgi:hypothetical protein
VYFNIRDRQPDVLRQILPPTVVKIGETFPVGDSATGLFLQERGPINAVVITAPGFREDLDFQFRGQKYRLHIGEKDYIVQMADMNPLKSLILMKVYKVN